MKKLLVSTGLGLLMAIAAPALVMAQEHRDEHSDRRGGDRAGSPAQAAPQRTAQAQPRNPQPGEPGFNRGNAPPPGVNVAPPGAMPPPLGGQNAAPAQQNNRGNAQNNQNQNNNFNNNNRGNNNFGNNNRGGNNFGNNNNNRNTRFNSRFRNQPNFSSMRRNFTAPRHFRAGNYNRPRGWYSHPWTFGEFLPVGFYTNNYWLADYQRYGLMPPPYGTVWVRVDNDALLIDEDDGEVIQVAYDVFY